MKCPVHLPGDKSGNRSRLYNHQMEGAEGGEMEKPKCCNQEMDLRVEYNFGDPNLGWKEAWFVCKKCEKTKSYESC